MSSGIAFFLYVVGASMVLGALTLLWSIGRSLRARNDGRHEVVDPQGMVWSTRLHWGRPGAGIGVARRLFPRQEAPQSSEKEPQTTANPAFVAPQPAAAAVEPASEPKRRRRSDWLDALDFGDEGFLLILGLLVTLGLFAAAIIVVLLAVELILILLIAAVLAVVRSLFGHPWVIEVIDPDGGSTFTSVRGLRRSLATHRRMRTSIETGIAEDPLQF